MIKALCFILAFVSGVFLGYFKGCFDEEERQRNMRKKIYSVRGEQ